MSVVLAKDCIAIEFEAIEFEKFNSLNLRNSTLDPRGNIFLIYYQSG